VPASSVAGAPADPATLINVRALVDAYHDLAPDPGVASQRVAFGTSGHRGSSLQRSFNEAHILAITQAICEHRARARVGGPLFLGIDTHALSEPALGTALEVLAANGIEVMLAAGGGWTPTPVVSHAILAHNRAAKGSRADGIVISPSHNPPEDGGFKYNPPHGGPAGSDITGWVQDRANQLLASGLREVRRLPVERARAASTVHEYDFRSPYVDDLAQAVDLDAVRSAGVRIGVDPLGGASVDYWPAVAERHGLDLTVVNTEVDPTFGFMTLDWDGRIRMDCSSPYAMRRLIDNATHFDVALGNDTDADRHGVVTPRGGLLNPNHYLTVAAAHLFSRRAGWPSTAAVGKTVVTSSMLDRVATDLGRRLVEVPVGFKWFVDGLLDASLGLGCEESAGASFLRQNGGVWTTDKDGILLCLLAAEITAVTGRDLADIYEELAGRFGPAAYRRVDAPATPEQKKRLGGLTRDSVTASELAGERITDVLTHAPGNGAPIGGVKVVTDRGWFAARPSGTEDVYKIYAESFAGEEHLERMLEEAQQLVDSALE
jgi:phosphoglucomutase